MQILESDSSSTFPLGQIHKVGLLVSSTLSPGHLPAKHQKIIVNIKLSL